MRAPCDTPLVSSPVEIVNAVDPRAEELQRQAYVIVAQSWGARLHLGDPADLTSLEALVAAAQGQGFHVVELTIDSANHIAQLDARCHDDYPATPATPSDRRDARDVRNLMTAGTRYFGACDGSELVGVTSIMRAEDRIETDRTCVDPGFRGRGLAVAVKATSVLALAKEGWRWFGTGGAATNAGSLAMNERVGYTITERWLTLKAPTP